MNQLLLPPKRRLVLPPEPRAALSPDELAWERELALGRLDHRRSMLGHGSIMSPGGPYTPPTNPVTVVSWAHAWYVEGTEFTALALADEAAVSSWPDEVGTADLAQATGSLQPLYDTVATNLNSQPGIKFDATDDYMKVTWSTVAQPYSIVVVAAMLRTGGARFLVSGDDATREHEISKTSTPNWRIRAGTDVVGGTPDTSKHLFTGYFNGASTVLEVDGTSVASGSAGAESSGGLVVNARYDFVGSSIANAHVAFIGFFSGGDVRTDSGWSSFEAWAASKYSLTIA